MMFISVRDLEQRDLNFREELAPETLNLGSDIRQAGPLRTGGRASLIEEHQAHKGVIQDIRLVGNVATRVELCCARCLEPVGRDVSRDFDLLYRPQGADAGREEISVTQAEAEIGYYRGEGLLLEEVLQEQILLAVPYRVVCREECLGLCPQCGQNLNQGKCQCAAPPPDERWTALRDLKDKLER
jgi:uncharacterized protein